MYFYLMQARQLVDSILKTIEIENAPANATDLIMQKISNSVMAKERKNGFYKFIISLFGFSILFSLVFALFFMPIKDGQSDSQYYTIKEKVFDFISNLSIPINTDLLAIITATLTIVILISGYFIFEEHKSFQEVCDHKYEFQNEKL